MKKRMMALLMTSLILSTTTPAQASDFTIIHSLVGSCGGFFAGFCPPFAPLIFMISLTEVTPILANPNITEEERDRYIKVLSYSFAGGFAVGFYIIAHSIYSATYSPIEGKIIFPDGTIRKVIEKNGIIQLL